MLTMAYEVSQLK